jgi:hypothetical protein
MGTMLQFRSTDFCGPLSLFVEAIEIAGTGQRPSIEFNSVIYGPNDLGAIAALLPDFALSAGHKAIVDKIGRHGPSSTYRMAAASLARCVDDAARSSRRRDLRASEVRRQA